MSINKEKIKGAINIGTIITLGTLVISGIIGAVTEMVGTRAIATQASTDSQQALTQTQANTVQIATITANVEWIKSALQDNGVKPRRETTSTKY